MTNFSATAIARRDVARYTAACRRPGSLSEAATDALGLRSADLSRVLLIDGRCLCKNNGIGNLFGDYVTWFTLAVLTDRALFIDWTDSTSAQDRRASNVSQCLQSHVGNVCNRVKRRFDLGAHFGAADGRVWRWDADARARVVAKHGAAAESVIFGRPFLPAAWVTPAYLASVPDCQSIAEQLISPSPWLTIRTTDDTGTAMLPYCEPRHKLPAGARRRGPTSFPDLPSARLLFEAFHERLLRQRRTAAARVVRDQILPHSMSPTELKRVGRPRLGLTLWSSPLAYTRPFPTAAETRDRVHGARLRAMALGGVDPPSRLSSAPPADEGHGQLAPLGMLTTCILHAMMRPREVLQAHLSPLLERIGDVSLATLQLRTGWADDVQEIPARVGRALSAPLPRLLAELAAAPAGSALGRLAAVMLDGRRPPSKGPSRSRGGRRGSSEPPPVGGEARPSGPARWASHLAPLMEGSASSVGEARWAVLTGGSCQLATAAAARDAEEARLADRCLAPSPAWVHTAVQRRALRGDLTDEGSVRRAFASGLRGHAVSLPGVNRSRFARVVTCAANVAQAMAHERRLSRLSNATADALGGAAAAQGAEAGAEAWRVYVSSDAAGLRALLEALPALRGRVVGCYPGKCTDRVHRAGSWRMPTAPEGLGLATDLWMLGAADSALMGSMTTLVYWASRAPPHRGRPQWINRLPFSQGGPSPHLGNKMLPLCAPAAAPPSPEQRLVPSDGRCGPDARPNYDRFPLDHAQDTDYVGCLARRFALLSEEAARVLEAA